MRTTLFLRMGMMGLAVVLELLVVSGTTFAEGQR